MTPSHPTLQAAALAEIVAIGGIANLTPAENLRIARLLVDSGHGMEQVAHAMANASCELMALMHATPGHVETSLCTPHMVALRRPEGVRYLALTTIQNVFQAATEGATEQANPNDTIH